ncbi:hypothetical protein C0989_006554 [Termitomyces sp. Mn162]|nr:hypothetical protein C0989_006554 [Termitomyces sp. Mn162]
MGREPDMGDANNEQDEDPANVDDDQAAKSKGTQVNDEDHIELETYKNDYYTWGSGSEGLFAFTEVTAAEHRVQEPSNEVYMHKVWIMVAKYAMDQPVLSAQDKECFVT